MRVLIVDDHERVRRGVREALARTLGEAELGEAGSAAEALRRVEQEPWDVVLLDLSLPDGSGVETLRALRALRPALPVLVMSMHPESQYGPVARAAGAAGYLPKGSDPETIAAAVRGVLGGSVIEGAAPPAAADERTGLARYLHDDLAQALAAAKISLQLARGSGDPVELQRRVAESIAALDSAISSVRRLAERLGGDR
jgi:DNA-binding NarL/FixJ family response regulator